MTLVVTMSATTAAYAAEAVKPSARVRGDGPAEQSMSLLATEHREKAAPTASIEMPRGATSLSLMMMSARERFPQSSRNEAVRRYREFLDDDAELDDDEPESET